MSPRVSANAWIGLLSVAALAGCATSAPSKVRVDSIEGSLPNCQTFSWNAAASADAESFTDQRVRNAVMQALEAKGYSQTADKADCRIAYHLTTQQNPQSKPRVGVGMGGGSGGVGGGVGISLPIGKKKNQSGTFTLDVIDATRNAQVWSGAVDATFESTELSDEEARSVVDTVLAKYPDRK